MRIEKRYRGRYVQLDPTGMTRGDLRKGDLLEYLGTSHFTFEVGEWDENGQLNGKMAVDRHDVDDPVVQDLCAPALLAHESDRGRLVWDTYSYWRPLTCKESKPEED